MRVVCSDQILKRDEKSKMKVLGATVVVAASLSAPLAASTGGNPKTVYTCSLLFLDSAIAVVLVNPVCLALN